MPKAELYKISVADGKVMLRIPEQLVGAETADMDYIQSELHMMDVDYVPEELLDIYNRTSGEFEFLTDVKTCLLYTSPSPRDKRQSRMPSSA